MQPYHSSKNVFNLNSDPFWLLVKDLCSWAHRVKVVNSCGGKEFEKREPIWGRGLYTNGKDMAHKMKLERIRQRTISNQRQQRKSS